MNSPLEIIPAILTTSAEDAKKKTDAVSPFVRWVQLDVCDGVFTPSACWGDPHTIRTHLQNVFVEVHLMVQSPEKSIDEWLDSGVKRIYIHYESTEYLQLILHKIRGAGIEAGVALLPQTPVDVVAGIADTIDAILLFSGHLGQYGGEFLEEPTLTNIATLRKQHADIMIEVDGGMNPHTAQQVYRSGARAIVSGGFIFQSDSVRDAVEQLKSVAYNENV